MPSRLTFTLQLSLALLGTRPGEAVAGTLLERTVAFVHKKPILLSDAELTRALLQIDLSDAIERTIDEALMDDEAARLVGQARGEDDVARAVLVLQAKAGPGFHVAALRRKALTQLAIARYIEVRLRPLVRVEDAEVRRVFNERMAEGPLAEGFSLVAPSIREALEQRSLDQKIEEWVSSLRRREVVRRPLSRPR